MKINTKTQLFEELTAVEETILERDIKNLVLTGDRNFSPVTKEMFDSWCEALGYKEERQKLLLLATAFPQRALLSIVNYLGSHHI